MKKERPILFSTAMVQAIIAERKTQTRRVVDCPPATTAIKWVENHEMVPSGSYTGWVVECDAPLLLPRKCPYGVPGDVLWVREGFKVEPTAGCSYGDSMMGKRLTVHYKAGGTLDLIGGEITTNSCHVDIPAAEFNTEQYGRWKPSIHIPRWASRITLTVKDIRVERLQEISPKDCVAEGIELPHWRDGEPPLIDHGIETEGRILRNSFKFLWDSINGKKHPWQSSPYVWVVTFEGTDHAT